MFVPIYSEGRGSETNTSPVLGPRLCFPPETSGGPRSSSRQASRFKNNNNQPQMSDHVAKQPKTQTYAKLPAVQPHRFSFLTSSCCFWFCSFTWTHLSAGRFKRHSFIHRTAVRHTSAFHTRFLVSPPLTSILTLNSLFSFILKEDRRQEVRWDSQ